MREAELGTQLADWQLVDTLILELEVRGKHAQAKQLLSLRSRAETHLHGAPGSFCLCQGDDVLQWHWVKRGRGQIYCGQHNVFLIPGCYLCGYRYADMSRESVWCPGCNAPVEGMLENSDLYEEELAQDESEVAARLGQCRGGVMYGGGDHVRRSRPLSLAEQAAAHNRSRECTVAGLAGRALEHYLAARRLHDQLKGKTFTRGELVDAYQAIAPQKEATTVLPSDYCLNANQAASENAWFLLRVERGRYQFVGIDGNCDRDIPAPTLNNSETTHESA